HPLPTATAFPFSTSTRHDVALAGWQTQHCPDKAVKIRHAVAAGHVDEVQSHVLQMAGIATVGQRLRGGRAPGAEGRVLGPARLIRAPTFTVGRPRWIAASSSKKTSL